MKLFIVDKSNNQYCKWFFKLAIPCFFFFLYILPMSFGSAAFWGIAVIYCIYNMAKLLIRSYFYIKDKSTEKQELYRQVIAIVIAFSSVGGAGYIHKLDRIAVATLASQIALDTQSTMIDSQLCPRVLIYPADIKEEGKALVYNGITGVPYSIRSRCDEKKGSFNLFVGYEIESGIWIDFLPAQGISVSFNQYSSSRKVVINNMNELDKLKQLNIRHFIF